MEVEDLQSGFFEKNVSLGVDIESIERFKEMINKFRRSTLKRIYTETELDYCFSKKNPAPSLAARFAFKEAAFKALSPLGERIFHRQVEIKNSSSGAPEARFVSEELNSKYLLKVTLSHSRHDAIAFVAAVKRDDS
ncbi:MAG: holo-[acyl-carrier-protein] synthase [candidate division Zixibacteria bacterium]|nr:holo-[acyl-carrier-protein] synthase [candidate division Zixibacteria bacterium]NIR62597.1 holo-[acyl-carrier-protein] synthase [candidate division Zixibacteria bacterium]NIS15928.1 holo-[acyl-carrier-protein] synthase [candidate division Zixibacteria bacterium]NIS44709.1 holo-[acyl-carrier-protein] synthase [candidate division Zixibacteria bacterium]NIT51920.1 holo-[acyl-carrier-protein] synthase [candidate division Zixibacteria bacterium]